MPKGVGFAPVDAALSPRIPPPAHSREYYKSRSLAARNWGALLASGGALRQLTPEEAQETVLRGLLATPTAGRTRNPLDWVVSSALHMAIIAAVVILPMAFTQALEPADLQTTYLSLPRPPAAPPPPHAPEVLVRHSFRRIQPAVLTMPTVIPKRIVEIKDVDAPDVGAGGAAGGGEGGENGGVLGGVLGGMSNGPAPPPAPGPAPAPKRSVLRVGGDVRPPQQIHRADPAYSIVAQKARVEGNVEVDAVIDEHGDVVQARAVSGPLLLIPAALKAVLQWKYQPTYLDGMPVSIEMKVVVSFHLPAS
jgi:periplasmic protein TonB